jgi:energy-coupling factor transporter ATP-binding protein EcfA2
MVRTVIDLVDITLVHGTLLTKDLNRRWQVAVLRAGGVRRFSHVGMAVAVVAETFHRGLERADRMQATMALRTDRQRDSSIASGPVLVLEDVSLRGPAGLTLLSEVTVSLERGSWTALAGPSGAGKSTLLRLIAGIERPERGHLARFGAQVTSTSLPKRIDGRVALVFQDPDDQFFRAHVLEDLLWGLEHRGLCGTAAVDRAREALGALRVDHLEDKEIATLSFGERKRVALAIALASEPEILLCDEPTMGLDPVASRQVARALEDANRRRNMSVVWATHDLDRLPDMVSRLWLLRQGRLVFAGERAQGLDPAMMVSAGLREPRHDAPEPAVGVGR